MDTLSAVAVEYADCTSAEEKDPTTTTYQNECPEYDTKLYLMV